MPTDPTLSAALDPSLPAGDSGLGAPGVESSRPPQVRDAGGRFQTPGVASGDPPGGAQAADQMAAVPGQTDPPAVDGGTEAQAAPAPKFPPALMDIASQYLTPDEIERVPSTDMLMDVVQARIGRLSARSSAARPEGQSKPKPPAQPETAPALEIEDFALPDDEEDPQAPMTAVSKYLNDFKGTLLARINEQQGKITELERKLGQSAQQSQQVAAQQTAAGWDEVAKSVPGMVEQLGLFSAALAAPNSPNGRVWAEVAPLVKARMDAQGGSTGYADKQRALVEAWAMYRSLRQNQAQPGGSNGQAAYGGDGRPGVAVRGEPRFAAAPPGKKDMTLEEDHEFRLGQIRAARAQRGGANPFA